MNEQGPSTATLLARWNQGDAWAREQLFAHFLPILSKWAKGRLPSFARFNSKETEDLVQVVMIRALNHLDSFEAHREGAFLAYLRTSMMNAVRDEIRAAKKIPGLDSLAENNPDLLPSPMESLLGKETLAAYEKGLSELPEKKRQAIILRVEFHYGYQQIAEALDCPSADAARRLVSRALTRLAQCLPQSSA